MTYLFVEKESILHASDSYNRAPSHLQVYQAREQCQKLPREQ